jgi:hypothetical protein
MPPTSPTPPASPTRSIAVATVLALLALLALHVALGVRMMGPMLFGDETAPLGIARFLAGRPPYPDMASAGMKHVSFYQPGYPLLLAPAWRLAGPLGVYRTALALNAVLLSALFPLLALFGRRVLGLARRDAGLAAFAASVYPSFVLHSNMAWSESLLLPLVVVVLLAFHRAAARLDTSSALGLAAAAAASYAVHQRALGLVPLAVLGLAALWRWNGLPGRSALAGSLAALGGFLAVRAWDAYLIPRLWPGGVIEREGSFAARLLDPAKLAAALLSLAGQLWYLSVTTAGLFPLGVVVLAGIAWRRSREREGGEAARATALFTLATAATFLFTSSLFVVEFDRVDKMIYGRYAETFLAPFLAAGLGGLLAGVLRRRRAGLAALTALVTLAPAALLAALFAGHGKAAFYGIYNQLNLFGIEHMILWLGGIRMLRLTAAGAALAVAVLLLGQRWPRAATILAGAFFLVGALHTYRVWLVPCNRAVNATVALPRAVRGLGPVREIAYDESAFTYGGFFAYQFWLHDVRFRFFSSDRETPPCPLVIAGKDFDRRAPGARMLFAEDGAEQALWRLRTPPRPGERQSIQISPK